MLLNLPTICWAQGVECMHETIAIEKVNEAYERMLKNDVRYRFVIDIQVSSSLSFLPHVLHVVKQDLLKYVLHAPDVCRAPSSSDDIRQYHNMNTT
jgi:hypothetical protein